MLRNSLAALAAVALLSSAAAHAAPHAGVDVQLYKPAFDGRGLFSLESGHTMTKHDFSFRLEVNYGQQPFRLPVPGIDDVGEDSVLKYALTLHFTLGLALTDNLSIGLDAGVYRTSADAGYGIRGRYNDDPTAGRPSTGLISLRPLSNRDPSGGFEDVGLSGPIDPRLGVKYRLLGNEASRLRLAAMATMSVPFGDEEMFLGDTNFVIEPRIAADVSLFGGSKLVANLGARIRERTVLEAYSPAAGQTADDAQAVFDIGSELTAGVGILYEALPRLLVVAEASFFVPLPDSLSYGDCKLYNGESCDALDDDDMTNGSYFDGQDYGDFAGFILGGLSYRITAETTFGVSAGAGVVGDRREDFRIVSGVRWQPVPEDEQEIGRGDRDGDGNPDKSDLCPDEPEDRDSFQDDDGCPEIDNDGDGIVDASDACVNEPEDRDGYQDDDGCPEADNDGDGVPDVSDRCPMDKEDPDGYEDSDGCPDEDNDNDSIPDKRDKCPNEPEIVNGNEDTDGCPDVAKRTGPVYRPGQNVIDLQGNVIEFAGRSANISAKSKAALDQVAGEIKANELQVAIEVHVSRSTRKTAGPAFKRATRLDQALSTKRAQAVRGYLMSQGVPAGQVTTFIGLGSSRPLNTFAPYDQAQNRVDFNVVFQENN